MIDEDDISYLAKNAHVCDECASKALKLLGISLSKKTGDFVNIVRSVQLEIEYEMTYNEYIITGDRFLLNKIREIEDQQTAIKTERQSPWVLFNAISVRYQGMNPATETLGMLIQKKLTLEKQNG